MMKTIKLGKDLTTLAECIAARKDAEEQERGCTLGDKNTIQLEYVLGNTEVCSNSFREIGMEFGDNMFKNSYPRNNQRFIKFYNMMDKARYSRSFEDACFSPVTIERFVAFADARDFVTYSLNLQNALNQYSKKVEEDSSLSAEQKAFKQDAAARLSFYLGYFYGAACEYSHKDENTK